MRLSIFAFTRRGCCLARQVRVALSPAECRMVTMAKFEEPDFEAYHPPLTDAVGELFAWCDQLVFIGSTGMAVRGIAPWVRDKKTDPGVIVIDEGGNYVISLLSGHIGGANALTKALARALHAQPIVTTATDVEGKFSVDTWATEQGLHIGSMALAKAVSAAILEETVPICADTPLPERLPKGLRPGNSGDLGIYVGIYSRQPFAKTLQLTPKVLTLGIGCRKNTPEAAIEEAVQAVLNAHAFSWEAVRSVASIDLKANEPGLLAFCAHHALPATFYTAQELLEAPGEFTGSSFVKSVTGVDNVCERGAVLGGGTLLVPKTAQSGVTVAVAEKNWAIRF